MGVIFEPCLHDARLYPYTRAEANAWMIFPYEIVHAARTTARLIQPADMARRFPVCFAYLTARKPPATGCGRLAIWARMCV